MEKKDYYDILGLDVNASPQEIKSAYRKQALKYHPDMAANDFKEQAEVLFKEISEAYYVLGHPHRRRDYNQYRQTEKNPNAASEEIPDVFKKTEFDQGDIRRYANAGFKNRQSFSFQRAIALAILAACGMILYFFLGKTVLNLSMILPGVMGFISVWYGNQQKESAGCVITAVGWLLLAIEIFIVISTAIHLKIWK